MQSPGLTPDDVPLKAIQDNGFAGVALRDVASDTYIMSRRRNSPNSNTIWQEGGFTAAELAPYANDGKKYTLDYIDYHKGTWGWTYLDNVTIPGTMETINLYSVTLDPFNPAHIAGSNITLRVSHGTAISALTPTLKFIPPAPATSCSPASGSQQDFTAGPITYTLISADLSITNIYSLKVVVMPDPSTALIGQWISFDEHLQDTSGHTLDGIHDGVPIGETITPRYSPDTPPGFGGSSLDLRFEEVGVKIKNTVNSDAAYSNIFDEGISNQFTIAFWAKGLPEKWSPWVSKRGEYGIGWQMRRLSGYDHDAGFTIRGVDNDDGSGSPVDLNDAAPIWRHFVGVWDQHSGTRNLYIDGVLSHVAYNNPTQTMTLAPKQALVIGARADGGSGFQNYFEGLIYDVRIYNQALLTNEIAVVMTTPTTQQPAHSKLKITSYGTTECQAVISTANRTIHLIVPFDTDLTTLQPTFTLSVGATCDRLPGETVDLNIPQIYTIKSADREITAVYTATASIAFNFNDTTLQGWNNRVWNLNANAGSGGWVDMEPDHIIIPATINNGVIQPPSGSNYLFGAINKYVAPFPKDLSASDDYHSNTIWVRSPEFYLNGTGDLTVQLCGGYARDGSAAPANESAVPMQADLEGGWMGVALRRVRDGVFVITKPATKVGESGSRSYRTTTFTQAELAPYVGSRGYTLDLINAHQGHWGWMRMDNVLIPGSSQPIPAGGTVMILK